MWPSTTETIVGFVLLVAGLAAIFTGSPWVGFTLVVLAVFILS
jgi:hypothetical protein